MKRFKLTAIAIAAGMTVCGGAAAHDGGTNDAGTPVCLEANYMLADAMNWPFCKDNVGCPAPGVISPTHPGGGPGRVIETNIFTGERGITVGNPFGGANAGTEVCPDEVACPGPWKPTGTFSGGQKGHAYITSAAQHALTELQRDGTPIRTVSYNGVLGTPGAGFGFVPRPLGTQIMPNGNLVQAICDANFFNAKNSDSVSPEGNTHSSGNASNLFFPPVYSTPERAANSRILVLDQDTLQVIDEYSQPKNHDYGHDLWGCAAGISFTEEGMLLSMFHTGAVLVVDWRDGVDSHSRGVGSNKPPKHGRTFKIGKHKNRARVTRIIDYVGGDADNPNRRDTLRANTLDESGNVYSTNRRRSQPCEEGDACNPGVFRQRISIDLVGVSGSLNEDGDPMDEDATLALDPGVNIIAGIRINRMSGVGCAEMQRRANNSEDGLTPADAGNVCDVETLYVAASAMNPGCALPGDVPPAVNPCLLRKGYVAEYLIDAAHLDGGSLAGDGSGACEGNPFNLATSAGCALPIATFEGQINGGEDLDPRMLMPIQRAFIQ